MCGCLGVSSQVGPCLLRQQETHEIASNPWNKYGGDINGPERVTYRPLEQNADPRIAAKATSSTGF